MINVQRSSCFLQVLEQRSVKSREQRWWQENKVAVKYYNHRIKKNGVFSDQVRLF